MTGTTHTREYPAKPDTVQEAIHQTIYGSGVTAKAIAADMNLTPGVLYEIGDETRPRRLKAEEIPSLVRASRDNFLVLDVIEASLGRVAFRVPRGHGAGDVLALSAETVKEFGGFLKTIAEADADGKWTAKELREAMRQRDLLFAAVSATIARAEIAVSERRK